MAPSVALRTWLELIVDRQELVGDVASSAGVRAWCQQQLGAVPVEELFRAGHLSLVVGLRLADDGRVVIKARPAAERVAGCVAVQQALALAGFACPWPLAGPQRVGGLLVTAEELVVGGERLAGQADAAGLFAGLLAELVRLAPPPWAVPPLAPSPPWVTWDRQDARLWPEADDLAADLNRHRGPGWLDQTAARVRARLAGRQTGPGSQRGPDRAVPGAYAQARGRAWTPTELQVCWASGLWVRCFNAKKDAVVGGGPQLDRLAAEVAERSHNAGIYESIGAKGPAATGNQMAQD